MCIYNVSCVKDDIGVFYTRSEKLEKEASQMSPINQSEKNLIECPSPLRNQFDNIHTFFPENFSESFCHPKNELEEKKGRD